MHALVHNILPSLFALLYVGGLIVAAFTDLASFIIPNRVVAVVGVAAAALLVLSWPGWAAAAVQAGLAAAVLVVGALLFFCHVWGAGDAKLLAAVALAAGVRGLPVVLLWMALVGGVLAGALLIIRRLPSIKQNDGESGGRTLFAAQAGVPYGVAIAIGGIAAFFQQSAMPLLAAFGW